MTVIVIAGPTASGKSALAMQLAKEKGGEIICADSRQIYAYMRIGTAAPSLEEMREVPHHGYCSIDPKISFDAGMFLKQTDSYISDILSRGRVPILVGGTGLYLRSFRYGLQDVPPSNEIVRKQLREERALYGLESLFHRLQQLDPETAHCLSPNDEVRIIRALEIFEICGKKPSLLRQSHHQLVPRIEADWLLVWPQRTQLKENIYHRAQKMMQNGLLEEARHLRSYLCNNEHSLLRTMGYEEALKVVDNHLTKDRAIELMALRQFQYAKRQQTWFKKEKWWRIVEI